MTQENKTVKWYEVYDTIAKFLFSFHEANLGFNQETGVALYNLLARNYEFKKHHTWFSNFGEGSFAIKSVDPIHIFASISSVSAPIKNKIVRVKTLLDALEIEYNFDNIDYEGCPQILITKVISTRRIETQNEIWRFFYDIFRDGIKAFSFEDFELHKYWYGLSLSSFTIFLFWIKSQEFLPLDQYVRTFITATRLVEYTPKDYESYKQLLFQISKENEDYTTEEYGSKGLFRELTAIAYKSIKLGITDLIYTRHLAELIGQEHSFQRNYGKRLTKEVSLKTEEILTDTIELSKLGFRIIALRALKGCKDEYINILTRDIIYQLDNAFKFDGDDVILDAKKTHNLFDIQGVHANDLKINISAVVGQNGSGKSSLVEFLFRIINNISYSYREELETNNLLLLEDLHAELYYILSGKLYCLVINNDEIKKYNYTFQNGKFSKSQPSKFTRYDFSNFFYTVAVNYSIYGLNSLQIGDWVRELFHKNDSYQAPLVINPMRTKGNFNINTENELVKYRLLGNLFSRNNEDVIAEENARMLTEKQEATAVIFEINEEKNKYLYILNEGSPNEEIIGFQRLIPNIDTILQEVKTVFELDYALLNEKYPEKEQQDVIEETKKYIVKKIVKIARQYPKYIGFFDSKNEKAVHIKQLSTYLNLLKADTSHVTYKLKQAINFLKYHDLYPKIKTLPINLKDFSLELDKYISQKEELDSVDKIELIPPSIYTPHIKLKDTKNDNISDFEYLSSGEKQRIHTVNSILYHIRNLDSIKDVNSSTKKELIAYPYINLILDEIELYHHPEMQRDYISFLLGMLKQLPLDNTLGLNICFITHSPFILSDIPKTNILFLDKRGLPYTTKVDVNTFGANIHELLIEGFFMKQTIGDYALFKVKQIIKFYSDVLLAQQNEIDDLRVRYETLQTEFYFIRDNIGEKYIQTTITNHLAFIETKLNLSNHDKN